MVTLLAVGLAGLPAGPAAAGARWEMTDAGREARDRGLAWLAANQGAAGNWDSNDLGLVALGVLAFVSAGHMPDRGPYGANVRRALDYILANARPSGLLNIAAGRRDMYNHGLATLALTQVYGMSDDRRIGPALDKAVQLISDVQCDDGGWDYVARRRARGHDLSLVAAQARALRGAMDAGMAVSPRTVVMTLGAARQYYKVTGEPDGLGDRYGDDPLAARPGVFTYDGTRTTTAMAAAGAMCLLDFGRGGDFRIYRSLDEVLAAIGKQRGDWSRREGVVPMDAYTLFYTVPALLHAGGRFWREGYPPLRDGLVAGQRLDEQDPAVHGSWDAGEHVGGRPGRLFGTAVAVFALSVPDRYLPMLRPRGPRSQRPAVAGGDDA